MTLCFLETKNFFKDLAIELIIVIVTIIIIIIIIIRRALQENCGVRHVTKDLVGVHRKGLQTVR